MKNYHAVLLILSMVLSGCTANLKEHYVLATTNTVTGMEVAQDPATQRPQAKFGYHRRELALVPTNRVYCKDEEGKWINSNCDPVPKGSEGAKDTANVLMEINYNSSIKDIATGWGLYQRLAVGEVAVKQPSTQLMFAKNPQGEISKESAQTLDNLILFREEADYQDIIKRKRTDDIIGYVTDENGALKSEEGKYLIQDLFDNAKIKKNDPYRKFVEEAKDGKDLRKRLRSNDDFIRPLNKAIPLD